MAIAQFGRCIRRELAATSAGLSLLAPSAAAALPSTGELIGGLPVQGRIELQVREEFMFDPVTAQDVAVMVETDRRELARRGTPQKRIDEKVARTRSDSERAAKERVRRFRTVCYWIPGQQRAITYHRIPDMQGDLVRRDTFPADGGCCTTSRGWSLKRDPNVPDMVEVVGPPVRPGKHFTCGDSAHLGNLSRIFWGGIALEQVVDVKRARRSSSGDRITLRSPLARWYADEAYMGTPQEVVIEFRKEGPFIPLSITVSSPDGQVHHSITSEDFRQFGDATFPSHFEFSTFDSQEPGKVLRTVRFEVVDLEGVSETPLPV